jgi:hypothetical protein
MQDLVDLLRVGQTVSLDPNSTMQLFCSIDKSDEGKIDRDALIQVVDGKKVAGEAGKGYANDISEARKRIC